MATLLAKLCRSQANTVDLETIHRKPIPSPTVPAVRSLATQQQTNREKLPRTGAELLAINDGGFALDEGHAMKLPDWTYGDAWSGASPADLDADHRSHEEPD